MSSSMCDVAMRVRHTLLASGNVGRADSFVNKVSEILWGH